MTSAAAPPLEALEALGALSKSPQARPRSHERACACCSPPRPSASPRQARAQQPVVLVVSGPSGVGKDAVVRLLQQRRPSVRFVVTATTRPMRPGEVHGVDYLFVGRPEFEALIRDGELLEHALVYGEHKGIPKSQVRDALAGGCDVVLRVDVQGAATMRRLLPGAVFVFLAAESEEALVRRLVSRQTELPDKLALRVATAREETRRMSEFDYVVVNEEGQLQRAVDSLAAIIDAEKCRVHRAPLPAL